MMHSLELTEAQLQQLLICHRTPGVSGWNIREHDTQDGHEYILVHVYGSYGRNTPMSENHRQYERWVRGDGLITRDDEDTGTTELAEWTPEVRAYMTKDNITEGIRMVLYYV